MAASPKLKEAMKPVPSDILAGILCFLKGSRFSGDPEKTHSTIARLQRHYSILDAFTFTRGDVYPFSRLLEDSLSILQRSRVIGMENPDYDAYCVKQESKQFIEEKVLGCFSDEDRQQLREIAEIFEAECGKAS
jgi:hypothetical protein